MLLGNTVVGVTRAVVLLAAVAALLLAISPMARYVQRSRVTYRAAVVEIHPHSYANWDGTAAGARALMLENVAAVDGWARRAAAAGAQIVVFPEDSINSFGGGGTHWKSRHETPGLFSEELPEVGTRLCDGPRARDPRWVVARACACVAQRHGLVLVVGVGITDKCSRPAIEATTGRWMPCDARAHRGYYDGAAAFGPRGELLAKYKKAHIAYSWFHNPDQWAEAPQVESVYFDAPFGVRFGLLIDNDANFGGPMDGLLEAGAGDLIWSTFWVNPPFTLSGRTASETAELSDGLPAPAFEAGVATGSGVNLLAANGGRGAVVTGSGVWPADPRAPAVQHYEPDYTKMLRDESGWLGVADVLSVPYPPKPPPKPRLPHAGLPALGENGTLRAAWFTLPMGDACTDDAATQIDVEVENAMGVRCALSARAACAPTGERARASYALVAASGLLPLGVPVELCGLSACVPGTALIECLYPALPTRNAPEPMPAAGAGAAPGFATFDKVRVSMRGVHVNTFWPSALCANGSVPYPRPRTGPRVSTESTEMWLDGEARCPLLSATLEARARWQEQRPVCPHGLSRCVGYDPAAPERWLGYQLPKKPEPQLIMKLFIWAVVAANVVLLLWTPLQTVGAWLYDGLASIWRSGYLMQLRWAAKGRPPLTIKGDAAAAA